MYLGLVLVGLDLREAEEILRKEGREYKVLITSKENIRFPRKKGISYPKVDKYRVIGQEIEGDLVKLWATEDISAYLLEEKLASLEE